MKASQRAQTIEPSLIRALRDKASTTSLDLGLGQTDLPVSEHVLALLQERLSPPAYASYGPNLGLMSMREAVAKRYGITADEVLITCGVQQGLALAFFGLVDDGDEVLIPDPGFPAYANLVRAAGATPVSYPLSEGTQDLDIALIRPLVSDKTRYILINSPSNPTGAVHEGKNMLAVLGELHDLGVNWISDEIYEDYVYDEEHVSPASDATLASCGVRLSGLSKSHHMMGWRLGWLTGPASIIDALKPLHQHMVTSASTLIQDAGVASLAVHDEVVSQSLAVFRERRDVVYERLMKIEGVACEKPRGAFYLWVDVHRLFRAGEDSLTFALDLLEQEDVVVIPGQGFGSAGESFIRIAYTIDKSRLEEAMDRFHRFCQRRLAERA